MAYARRTTDQGWYIYRSGVDARSGEPQIFIQGPYRVGATADGRDLFGYREIKEMIEMQRFELVPGYTPEDQLVLARALAEFLRDVEGEGSAA